MAKFDYTDTYWNNSGKHQKKLEELQKVIPSQGECKEGGALEELRLAQNAYHDLYNNGGGNRDAAILYYSGVDTSYGKDGGFHNTGDDFDTLLDGHDWDDVARAMEPALDELILDAWTEYEMALAAEADSGLHIVSFKMEMQGPLTHEMIIATIQELAGDGTLEYEIDP